MLTPRLELRLGSRNELVALGELARRGIHPPDEMPFSVAWTDNAASPGFVDDFVAFHDGALERWSLDRWTLNLLALHGGSVVGTQSIGGDDFAATRHVETGSWLGATHQGRGLGTEMRAAVLELAFRGLAARTAGTGVLEGNAASARVSAKLGYEDAGIATQAPRGVPVREQKLVRRREGWVSPVRVDIVGLEPTLPLFGL